MDVSEPLGRCAACGVARVSAMVGAYVSTAFYDVRLCAD
jgi:hypothetical protein